MFSASPAAASDSSWPSMSSGPPPSGLRISVVTPCVSMFSARGSAAGSAWLWMLMKPGAT